jgi:hypothetical protein
VIELPAARRALYREITIVGNGFRLAPAVGEHVHGDVDGHTAFRLVPLLNDQPSESDGWAVLG